MVTLPAATAQADLHVGQADGFAAFAVSHVLDFNGRKPPFSVEAQKTPNSSVARPAGHQIQEAGNVLSGLPSPTSRVSDAPRQQPWPSTQRGCSWRPRGNRFITERLAAETGGYEPSPTL